MVNHDYTTMADFFEIAGTHILYSDIRDFRVVQREFIYRPTYIENNHIILGGLLGKRYEFSGMQPYAAILNESSRSSPLSEYKAKNIKESIIKEVFEDTVTTIGDTFNIKVLRAKKYQCISLTGRRFSTYLEDVPATLTRNDGKVSDVQRNDELYSLLGEPIAPTVKIIDALMIKAEKESYIFYGCGIQIADAMQSYQQLSIELDAYKAARRNSNNKHKVALPKIEFKPVMYRLPIKKHKSIKTNTNIEYSPDEIIEAEAIEIEPANENYDS